MSKETDGPNWSTVQRTIESSKWEAITEAWHRVATDAMQAWNEALDARNDLAGDDDTRAALSDQADVLWRDRCIADMYAKLAKVRQYMAKYDLALPGLVIPDSLFDTK